MVNNQRARRFDGGSRLTIMRLSSWSVRRLGGGDFECLRFIQDKLVSICIPYLLYNMMIGLGLGSIVKYYACKLGKRAHIFCFSSRLSTFSFKLHNSIKRSRVFKQSNNLCCCYYGNKCVTIGGSGSAHLATTRQGSDSREIKPRPLQPVQQQVQSLMMSQKYKDQSECSRRSYLKHVMASRSKVW